MTLVYRRGWLVIQNNGKRGEDVSVPCIVIPWDVVCWHRVIRNLEDALKSSVIFFVPTTTVGHLLQGVRKAT
jgi:hypothetical protein